jgi:hypothetical protein
MKIIRIEKCGECPYYSYYPNAKGYYCSKMGFVLPETGIPEWCPLHTVDHACLYLIAKKIKSGEARDDLIKLAKYLEGEEE